MWDGKEDEKRAYRVWCEERMRYLQSYDYKVRHIGLFPAGTVIEDGKSEVRWIPGEVNGDRWPEVTTAYHHQGE